MAAEEIDEFLRSGELGKEASHNSDTLTRAAEKMFTAKGLVCPVAIVKRNRKTYIIRREALPGGIVT